MGTPEKEMPSLTISLPQGWGERELASLLAPVKGVRIEVAREGGPAFIQFECEADALQARSLMRTLSKDEPVPVVPPAAAASPHGSYSSWSASPVPQPEPVSSLGLCPPPAVVPAYVPTVSTTLLVSYRHSWRLVEALHGSLLDIGRGGPLQRADDILHKLEVARLQQRIDEKEATITDLRAAPEAAAAAGRGGGGGGDRPVSGDIHEQLNSAATMIQNTQKQLAEARERGRRSEQQREAHRKGEDAAKQQLTEALELHSKELARKSEQADELSTRLGAIDAVRSLEYKEIYARFEHASTEVAEVRNDAFTHIFLCCDHQHQQNTHTVVSFGAREYASPHPDPCRRNANPVRQAARRLPDGEGGGIACGVFWRHTPTHHLPTTGLVQHRGATACREGGCRADVAARARCVGAPDS